MMPDEKKEKVLHTRIPQALDEEIRGHASQLGVSVSNLVRNVLQNAFGLVGDIVADTTSIAQSTRSVARPVAPAPSAPSASLRIVGWQEARLALNAVCDGCNAILPRGSRAGIAVLDGPGARIFRCMTCLEQELGHEPDADPE
jgi:hypothetical protein